MKNLTRRNLFKLTAGVAAAVAITGSYGSVQANAPYTMREDDWLIIDTHEAGASTITILDKHNNVIIGPQPYPQPHTQFADYRTRRQYRSPRPAPGPLTDFRNRRQRRQSGC